MSLDTYRITGSIADAIGSHDGDSSDELYGQILAIFARHGLQVRPTPAPTEAELAAIDGIRAAYLACNATDTGQAGSDRSPLVYEVTPGNTYGGEPTAMGHLAEAARKAWDALGLPGTYLWELMQDSGEGAAYVYRYWAREVTSA